MLTHYPNTTHYYHASPPIVLVQQQSLMLRHPHHALKHPRQQRALNNDDQERFSSFESPAPSDGEHEEFSDFETSREKEKQPIKGQSSAKKEKSHILVEQLPLQCDSFGSSRKGKQQRHLERSSSKASKPEPVSSSSKSKRPESTRWKENCPPRYNYMQKIERHLSTIAEDTKEHLRESAFTSLHAYRPDHTSKVTPFDPIWPHTAHLRQDPNIILLEKQRMEMMLLQQENISLRERVFLLEKELKARDEQRIKKEVEAKIASMTQEEPISRKEAKLKLVEEVANLQARCRQMKEEMRQYKQKQEETFAKLTQQRESAQLEVVRLKAAHEYQAKFTDVFLNMVEKLPVDLEQSWSKKRKIAVGWKVVKHLVKKAFKLGIHPPAIAS